MQYLNTNEIGFDRTALGFPSVQTCQAIVYETASALYGFHDPFGGPAKFKEKCKAFAQFVQERAINHTWHAICIIGVITTYERFKDNQQGDWQAQLVEVATQLKFSGPIFGGRLLDHVNDKDSTYIRFDRQAYQSGAQPPTSTVRYRTWSEMEFGDEAPNSNWHRRMLKIDPGVDFRKFKTVEEANQAPHIAAVATEKNRPVREKEGLNEGALHTCNNLIKFR